MSQSTVPALGAASFDVTFEAVGFTSEDLSGCDLTDTEGEGFTVTAIAENQFPEGVTAVIRGHISEDDAQGSASRKVFVCITLRVLAQNALRASRTAAPVHLLTRVADTMATSSAGECPLTLEGNWQVTEVEPVYGAANVVLRPYAVELRRKAAELLRQASRIDGLQPYILTHRHEEGSSGYIGWFPTSPTETQAAVVLESRFEPERGEELSIEDSVSLDELTGVTAPDDLPKASAAA